MLKKHVLFAAVIGPALEFYDFALFGIFAPVIAKEFFPVSDLDMVFTLLVFIAGFLMRPVGGIIFGYIADTHGRKRALYISIFAMALCTFLMGITPSYKEIGIYSTIIIILCRCTQGLCLGGEQISAAVFIIEHNMNKKSTYGSLVFLGLLCGGVLSTMIGYFFIKQNAYTWAWRIPFILSLLIGVIGIYIRSNVIESPVFLNDMSVKKDKISLWHLIRDYKIPLLIALGAGAYSGVLGYTQGVYFTILMTKFIGYSLPDSMLLSAFGLGVAMVFTVISGLLSDRLSLNKFLMFAAATGIFSGYIIYSFYSTADIHYIIFAQILLGISNGLFNGSIYAFLIGLFPPQIRCLAISAGYSLGLAIFGSTVPLISTLLTQFFNDIKMPFIYFTIVAIVGLISIVEGNKHTKVSV